jgi:hypothetical protein
MRKLSVPQVRQEGRISCGGGASTVVPAMVCWAVSSLFEEGMEAVLDSP